MPAHSDTDNSDYERQVDLTEEGGVELQPFDGEGGTATGRQAPDDGSVIRRGTGGRADTDLERRLAPGSRVDSSGTTVWKWNLLNVSLTAGALVAVFGASAVLMAMYITDTQPKRINRQYLRPVDPPPYTIACYSSEATEGPGNAAEATGTIDEEEHVLTCCINTACDDTAEKTTFTVNPSDWDQGKVDKEGSLHRFAVYKVLDADHLRGKELSVTATLSQAPTSAKSVLPTAGGTFAPPSTLHG